MDAIVGISGAATIAMLLVALFKFGVPAATSAQIAGTAFIAGQLSAVLTTAAQGGLALTQRVIGTVIATGILAAASATGIRRLDQKADAISKES